MFSITIGLNPVLSLGPVHVAWYGIMTALAVVTVLLWTWRAARGSGISGDTVFTAAIWAIPFGVAWARLFHVVDKLDYYLTHPGQVIGLQGLSIYGAVAGAALGIWLHSRIKAFPFWQFLDLAAPGVILGQAVGRVGNVINGDAPGTATSLPWGFVYTHPDSYASPGEEGHPAVVYEMLWDLVVFGLLLRLRGKLRPDGFTLNVFTVKGSLFLVYLSLYSLGRFFIGYLRAGTDFVPGLQQAQLIALLVLVVAPLVLVYRVRGEK